MDLHVGGMHLRVCARVCISVCVYIFVFESLCLCVCACSSILWVLLCWTDGFSNASFHIRNRENAFVGMTNPPNSRSIHELVKQLLKISEDYYYYHHYYSLHKFFMQVVTGCLH